MKYPLERTDRLAALRIIGIYALFAALWIYLSDEVLGMLIRDTAILVRISVFKGFLFIVVTAVLLYQLIARHIRKSTEIENELRLSEKRYHSLFEHMLEGYAYCKMLFDERGLPKDFVYLEVNDSFERLTGLTGVVGKKVTEVLQDIKESSPELFEIYGRVASTGKPERFEINFEPLKSWLSISVYSPEREHFVAVFDNITARKRSEETREATIELLRICNEADNKRELMQGLTLFFQKLTGCEAVGVRLPDGDDFPYYETRGFSDEFVLAENRLCAFDQAGEMVRDSVGHPVYACMCGNIIAGRFNPAKSFFTSHGSFWTGSTTELLAGMADGDRLATTRNCCNGDGYESVALVPLRSHGETFGLFQFNDPRRERFTAEKIALMESLVAYVAIALAKLRVDEALQESSRFSRQIIDSAEEGIIVYGRDMRYQVWNPFMEKLTGKMASEVIGRHPLESFPFLRESGVIENIQKVLAGQSLASIEFLQSAHTGRLRWISDTCVPLRNTNGEIIGAIGTVLDITDHKLAQEELKEVTQRLQLATASGQLGIWDWDIIDDAVVWNDRMFEFYGVSRDEYRMSHEAWEKSVHPDDREKAIDAINAALSGERKYDIEFRVVHPDGAIKYIKTDAVVIRDKDGKAVRMIGMAQDITDRKHMEEQLRQAQKMEAIGQLAGGVAHDFNNILTAIYGHCSVLQMKMGKDAPFRSDIDQIYAAAERAANLTRSLLAFSRKQIMSPKKINLNEIVMNVGKLLNRIIGEDIQLKTVCSGKPLRVFADSGQIEQVLMNLAANARDAMTNGGILTIETGVQEIDESFIHAYGYGEVGKYAALSVSDTGKGMDAETSKKIFEPFFTTKEVGKGTGLGLSIVYGVIKQHNGYINVYSEPDEGTTFRIYLPQVYEEDADYEKEAPPEFPRMGSETVLVAEDDAIIRELAGSILKKFGYDVILACDGEDAVEKFKAGKEKIAIIVMDMIMPRKSGKEAYEEIRKFRPDVKILFMSGYSPDLLQDRGVSAKGDEVLIKPIHPLELVRKVRTVLDS